MSDFPINSTARVYYDAEESPCTLSQMVKHDPEWAENRIREGEKAIAERDALVEKLVKAERIADREATCFRAMCEALERLEQIVGLDTGGGMGPGLALNAVEHIIRQRDALVAHVERLETLLYGAQLGLRWFRDEHPDEDTETDAEFDTQIAVALQSGPTTSLSRRQAEEAAK